MQRPGFWDDQAKAAEISEQHARAKKRLEGFSSLSRTSAISPSWQSSPRRTRRWPRS